MLLDDFQTSISLQVPDAPPQLIQDCLRKALATFCKLSTAWRQNLGSVLLIADKATYDLSGKADAPICAITSVRITSTQAPVTSTTEEHMDLNFPGWRLAKGKTPLRYLAPDAPDQMRLYPLPDTEAVGGSVDVQVACYPGTDTTEIPDALGQMFFDAIVAGAAGVLQGLPKKPWTDISMSRQADSDLRAAARDARVRIEKSNTRSKVTAITTSFDDL